MSKKNKILSLCLMAIVCITIFICSITAIGTNMYYDFENKNFEWNPLYGNAAYEFLSEDNGNTYLKLSYNGNNGRSREYFDVEASSQSIYYLDKLQVDYDVMYTEFTEDRDGEMQVKYRIGPGSSETTMVARVAQVNGYLQVQGGTGVGYQRIRGIDGNYYQMEINHWYTVKMTVDLENHIQTTYVFDRDTGSLLALNQQISTINDIQNVNMVTFSSKTSMCLDNVKIYEPTCENSYIYGSPYLKKGQKNRYYFLGKGIDGTATGLPYGTTTWSIVNPKTGVSINASSGTLNCSSTVEPGTVIIKAERTVDDATYEAKFAVNITN